MSKEIYSKVRKRYMVRMVQVAFLVLCGILWQWYAASRNIMGFPALDVIIAHLIDSFTSSRQPILIYMAHSFALILEGMLIGAVAATVLSSLSITTVLPRYTTCRNPL